MQIVILSCNAIGLLVEAELQQSARPQDIDYSPRRPQPFVRSQPAKPEPSGARGSCGSSARLAPGALHRSARFLRARPRLRLVRTPPAAIAACSSRPFADRAGQTACVKIQAGRLAVSRDARGTIHVILGSRRHADTDRVEPQDVACR